MPSGSGYSRVVEHHVRREAGVERTIEALLRAGAKARALALVALFGVVGGVVADAPEAVGVALVLDLAVEAKVVGGPVEVGVDLEDRLTARSDEREKAEARDAPFGHVLGEPKKCTKRPPKPTCVSGVYA